MKNVSGIYQIKNTITGKLYIGSAVNINDRWYRHRLHLRNGHHNCKPLQSSWNKHGELSFEFSVLEFLNGTDNLLTREQFYLDSIRPFDNKIGYNCCPKAYSTIGIKYTAESKEKLSASTKLSHSKGVYDESNKLKKGKKLTEEHKAKIATSLEKLKANGYVHSAERNAKIAASRTGKKYPALSASLKDSAAARRKKVEIQTVCVI